MEKSIGGYIISFFQCNLQNQIGLSPDQKKIVKARSGIIVAIRIEYLPPGRMINNSEGGSKLLAANGSNLMAIDITH
jgi:hypothetical protein